MEVSVSVIIPIFKAESYLCKCLDSFVNQDFTNFELILVDDGRAGLDRPLSETFSTS